MRNSEDEREDEGRFRVIFFFFPINDPGKICGAQGKEGNPRVNEDIQRERKV